VLFRSIGANDTVNSGAEEFPDSPIAGISNFILPIYLIKKACLSYKYGKPNTVLC